MLPPFFPLREITVGALAKQLALPLEGDGKIPLQGAAPLLDATRHQVSFLEKKITQANQTRAAVVIVKKEHAALLPRPTPKLFSENPKADFARALSFLYDFSLISTPQTTAIHPTAKLGKGVKVGFGSVIGAHVVVGDETIIADNVSLHACVIGARCLIHPGVRVGQDGFGFTAAQSENIKIPHVGRVDIGDDVEIGANTCIDRGTFTATRIGEGVKIDNLVQIAHNVQVGNGTRICGQTGLAGSCVIGKNVVLGGQVGVADHTTLADGVQVAGASHVMQNITEPNSVWAGSPAMPIAQWRRLVVGQRRVESAADAE